MLLKFGLHVTYWAIKCKIDVSLQKICSERIVLKTGGREVQKIRKKPTKNHHNIKSIIVSERYCNSKVLGQYELTYFKEFLMSTDQ